MTHFFKIPGENGGFAFGSATDEEAIPDGAIAFVDRDAFEAAIAAAGAPATSLASAKVARLALLTTACAAAITGGYASSALGASHWYGSMLTDQANLDSDMMAAASGGASVTATIVCSADGGATWAPQEHSAAQIAALWGDFRTWRVACQSKNRAFQAQVAGAVTLDALNAIVWA